MKTSRLVFSLLLLGALVLQACGASSADAVATSVAATLQISQLETAAAGGGQANTAGQSGTGDQSGAGDQSGGTGAQGQDVPTSTSTPTPTQGVPMVSVSQDTNCRSGPRVDYTYVTVINAGQQVEVLKTFPNANYVVVKNPNGTGDCWLWLQYATQTDFSSFGLPQATQPPTPTPSLTPTSTATATPQFVWTGSWTIQFGVVALSGPIAQTGNSITAQFSGGGFTYDISGTLDASWQTATGTWDLQGGGDGVFVWKMFGNLNQFNGNGDSGTYQFCGARNGAGLPAPCMGP